MRTLSDHWQAMRSCLRPPKGLRARLAATESENRDLRNQIEAVRDAQRDSETRLQAALEGTQRALDEMHAEETAAQQRIAQMQSALDQADSARRATEQVLAKQQLTLQRSEAAQARLDKQIEGLCAEREAGRREVDTLAAALREAHTLQQDTEQHLAALAAATRRKREAHRRDMDNSREQAKVQTRRVGAALTVATVALLLAATTTGLMHFGNRENATLLAELRQELLDVTAALQAHAGKLDSVMTQSDIPQAPVGSSGGAQESVTLQATPTPGKDMQRRRAEPLSPSFEFDQAWNLQRRQTGDTRTREEMQAFFERNAREAGVISLPSGLQYRVLNRGSGPSPSPDDRVMMEYRAFLSDGTQLYSTLDADAPAEFNLEAVIPALREALPRMQAGDIWELYVPPALAYRSDTRQRGKYGNEPLIYVVRLVSVVGRHAAAVLD